MKCTKLLAVVFALCLCGAVSAQHWNPTVVIGSGWNNQDMVFDSAGNAYLVWAGLSFSRSLDHGSTWSAPVFLGPTPGRPGNPDIAIDSAGALYAVVEFMPAGAGRFQLYFRKSADGGANWSLPVQITNTLKHTAWPKIDVDALGRVHVFWQDQCNLHNWSDPPLPGCTTNEYYHLISTDQGLHWSEPHLVASTSHWGWTLHSAVDSTGAIYGFWTYWPGAPEPPGLYMHKSTDGGVTWTRTLVGSGNQSGSPNESGASIDGHDTVHVIFARGTQESRDFIYRSGAGGGQVWTEEQRLGTGSGHSGFNPSAWCTIAADRDGRNVLVAWQDGASGDFEVYGRRSRDGGETWQEVEDVSGTITPSLQPEIFIDRDSLAHIVWNEVWDQEPPFYVYYRRGPLNDQPVANAGSDQVLECCAPGGNPVTLDGSASSDPDGDSLTYVWTDGDGQVVGSEATVELTLPRGSDTFTLTVTDPYGLSSSATTHVTVEDTVAPAFSVTMTPSVIWPPDNKLKTVSATIQASDACDASPRVELMSIASNEPLAASDIQGAAFGTDDRTFQLRATRAGKGSGRIYTITYRVTDAAGNSTVQVVQVVVPHS